MSAPVFYTLTPHEQTHCFCAIGTIGYQERSLLIDLNPSRIEGQDEESREFLRQWPRYAISGFAAGKLKLFDDVSTGIKSTLASMLEKKQAQINCNYRSGRITVTLCTQDIQAEDVLAALDTRNLSRAHAPYPSFLPPSAARELLAILPPDIDHDGGGKGPVAEEAPPKPMTMAAGAGAGAPSPLKWAMRNDTPPSRS